MTSAEANTNVACCTIPPVQSEGYTPKGEYKAYGGFSKVYMTGPKDTGRAIIEHYDAFGYTSQTLQAADILAESSNALLVMPDFFDGKPLDLKLFPPKTDEEKKAVQTFFSTIATVTPAIPKLHAVVETLRADGATKVGAVGYCYGAKVVTVGANSASKIDAVSACHPAFVSPDDANELACPIAFFTSKDEDVVVCDAFWKVLESKPYAAQNVYKRYPTVHHGWAGARANLKDEENLKQYQDVLQRMATFYTSVWGN